MLIAINMASDEETGRRAAESLRTAARRFLKREVPSAGQVCFDPLVAAAVRRQQPFVTLFPERPASIELRAIADRLSREHVRRNLGVSSWQQKLAGIVFVPRDRHSGTRPR